MAKLQEKRGIWELVFEWSKERADVGQDDDVLEGLQPHSDLEGLWIRNYGGCNFPSWLPSRSINNSQSSLPKLIRLTLDSCSNCVKLPSLGHLPNLTCLFINGLSGVKMIDADFYGNGNFPALKEFELQHMESLDEWFDATRSDLFPSLEKLSICDCGNLRSIQLTNGLPRLKTLTCRSLGVSHIPPVVFSSKCLRELEISGCGELKLLPSFHELCSLTHLELYRCKDLRCAPGGLQHCTSLQRLELSNCRAMSSELEWLESLKNLVELEIAECNNIVWDKIPETSWGCLTHLKRSSFGFGDAYKAPELPPCFTSIHHLHGSLIELQLSGGPNIKSLPHQMQQLTTLQELKLNEFGGLETLPQWLGSLSSLEKLRILRCKKLRNLSPLKAMRSLTHLTLEFREEIPQYFDSIHQSMPSSLKELTLGGLWCSTLPPQIQHLTTLEVLEINHFDAIEYLPEWLGNLSSLQRLEIYFCRRLSKLPSQQSMLRLSNLKSISIFGCGNMSRICVEGSTEWSKISHIPDIRIW